MNIGFLLWLALSAALLYFMGWTFFILQKQKQAWKSFAAKNKMRYTPNNIFSNPELKGVIEDYTVSVFTSEHGAADMRSTRKLTAVEVALHGAMPIAGGVASAGMVPIIQGMGFQHEIQPRHDEWQKTYVAATDNREAMRAYLAEERLRALISLMKMTNAWVIFIFRGNVTLLRVDTPNPLDSVEKLDQLIKKMIEVARALELKSGEAARLKFEDSKKSPEREVAITLKEDAPAISLQLEDDQS